ncbi:extracellular solute-binding protein, partial [Salinispira pacifica]
MKRLLMIFIATLVAAGMTFASGSSEGTAAAVASAPSNTELKGDLVVYSTIFAEYADAMKASFEKKYPGVTVHVVNPGGTEAMMKKLEAEKDNPQADVIHSGATLNYAYAKAQGLIAPYKPNARGFKPSIKLGSSTLSLADPEDYYHVWSLMFSGIMYNKQVMDQYKLPYPKTYKDLTNPVYKDRIISANPLKSSTAVTNVMATIA